MAKYSIESDDRYSEQYTTLLRTDGLHIHSDASDDETNVDIGLVIDRVVDSESERLGTERESARTHTTKLAEMRALVRAAEIGDKLRNDGEHLFLYTESRHALRSAYGVMNADYHRKSIKEARHLMTVLPDPRTYTIALCDSKLNPSHYVANGEGIQQPDRPEKQETITNIEMTAAAKSKEHRMFTEEQLRHLVKSGVRGNATVYKKGASEYHILSGDYAVVVVVEGDTATVVTQSHQHEDYMSSRTYESVGRVGY